MDLRLLSAAGAQRGQGLSAEEQEQVAGLSNLRHCFKALGIHQHRHSARCLTPFRLRGVELSAAHYLPSGSARMFSDPAAPDGKAGGCRVHHLGLALGGRPAASFATRLMLPVSNDTVLRSFVPRTYALASLGWGTHYRVRELASQCKATEIWRCHNV